MILLNSIVEIAVAAMANLLAESLTNRSRIGVMSVGRHTRGRLSSHLQGGLEKALGRVHITMFTQHRIDEIAISIDGAVEVCPHTSNFDVGFIHMPGAAGLSLAFSSQFV